MDHVVIVNEQDDAIGTMEKMEAHRTGTLHRAFSVVLYNSRGQLLLQKRSARKYHSGSLWTNTCCSHPRPGEQDLQAVHRKLKQEMGIEMFPGFAFKFHYKVELDNGLTENEIDHVYTGIFDGEPLANPEEVEAWKFISWPDLKKDLEKNPQQYTFWFRKIVAHESFLMPVPAR